MSELHKFIFDGMPVRGMLVRLDDSWREVLQRRALANDAFAQPVRVLMGEMAAAATLMQASIKFEGALVLQIFGDGPVKLAVAEVQSDLAFRVTA
jgi:molecular chaperone Hsp33